MCMHVVLVCCVCVCCAHPRTKANLLCDFTQVLANFEGEVAAAAHKDEKLTVFKDDITKQLTTVNQFLRDTHVQLHIYETQNEADVNLC